MNLFRKDNTRYKVWMASHPENQAIGTTCVRYLGDNLKDAVKAFKTARIGVDGWMQPDDRFGVILGEWEDGSREWEPMMLRFPEKG